MMNTTSNYCYFKIKASDENESKSLIENEVTNSSEDETINNGKNEMSSKSDNSSTCKNISGFTLALLASTIFTVNGVLVQYFELDPVDTVTVRSAFQIIFLGLFIKIKG